MAESDASIEAQLELKKRARRRLVGAAALALLAAIVLPMVMDHEPRPSNQDIQVRIPSPDANGGFSSRILPAKPAATPLPPLAADAASAPKPDTKPEAKAKAEAASKAGATPAPAEKADAQAGKAPEKAPPKTAEAKAADVKGDAKPSEPKPAEHKTAEHKSEDAPQAAVGQWVVQLGAYKETGNVKLLLSKLKEMGVPAFTEKFDSPQGPRTRVRAGPFASKEAAEKARAKAKIIGVDGPVAPK
jgi:DedD protein